MNDLMFTDWLAILSGLGVIVALITNIASMHTKNQDKVAELAELRADVKHIREQVDKDDRFLENIDNKTDGIDRRLVAVEQSTKQAHHRIDEMQKKG